MVNKRVTLKEDPLTPIIIRIPQSQKRFLENMDESISSYIRKLIASQMSGHEVEIIKLEDEARQHETHLNIIKAQIAELEVTDKRKQAAGKNRQTRLDEMSDRLVKGNRILDFKDRAFIRVFKNNIEDANKKLNGIGEPITEKELKEQTILKAKELGRAVYV